MSVKREIRTMEDLINAMHESLNLSTNQTIVAVFEDDDSDEIIGWRIFTFNEYGEQISVSRVFSNEEITHYNQIVK